MKKDDLKNYAQKIANLVEKTNTEDRGDLLLEVAAKLEQKSQHFTSAIFYAAGNKYNNS